MLTPDLLPVSVFNALPGAYLLLTPAFVIEAASDDYLTATLTTREQVVGRAIFDAFPNNPAAPEAHATHDLRTSLARVLATGQPHQMAPQHYEVPDPEQAGGFAERHWRCTNRPVFDADGRVTHLLHAAVDITAQHRAERQLRSSQAAEQSARTEAAQQHSERRYFIEQAPVAVAVYRGPRFCVELANAATLAIWDRPLDAVLGRPVFEVLPEAATPEVVAIFERVFATGTAHTAREQPTTIHRHGRPEVVYWNFVFQPQRGPDGRISGIISVGTDITEQVRARQQVEQLNQELEARVQARTRQANAQGQRLERLLAQAPAAICILSGPELVFELVNPFYQQFFPDRPLLGRPLLEALPELTDHAAYHTMRRVFDTGETNGQQALHTPLARRTDGQLEDRYFTYVQQPRYDEHGRIDGVLVFGFEVTELIQARHQADELQAQLLAASQRQAAERESLYRVFAQTPAVVALLRDPGHRFEYVNPAYQALFPGRPLVGREVAEAAPELVAQGFGTLLDEVYRSGETYFGQEMAFAPPPAPGQVPRTAYYNFTYQAYQENGAVAGVSIFAYDVTEQMLARREREAERQHERQQLYELFMQAPAPIVILDGPELVFQLINPAYQRIFPGRDLLNKPLLKALPELVGTPIPDLFQGVYQTGEPVTVHELPLLMARSEGAAPENIYWTFTYQARRDAHGIIDGVRVFAHDVTEPVLARRHVEASEQQVRALVESAPFPIGVYEGEDLRVRLANDAMLTTWGKGPDVIGRRYADVLPELADQAVFEQMHHVRTTGEPLHLRNQRLELVREGIPQAFYFNYSFTPLRDAAGAVYGVLNTAADVTDLALARQRLEAYAGELQESEARFRTMADAAPNQVWAVNPDSTIRYVNRAFLDFVGLRTEQEYAATGWGPYIHPDELELTQGTLTRAIAARIPYVLEHRMRHHDGQYRWLLSQGAPSYLSNGELYGYVGSAIDITELKQTNAQLVRTNVDLDNFIYTASHDLKAPISNIEGLLDALREELREELPPQAAGSGVPYILGLMQDSVHRFTRTIGQLTDVSRLQKEHDQPPGPVPLAGIIEDVRLDLAPLLLQTGGRLDVDVRAVPTVQFLEKNLRSVVYNLLSNALKYRHPDWAPVVRVRGRATGAHQVLEVQDNGLGLDLGRERELFGMFRRYHTHVAGSGLGLYMVKRMVENTGGRIEVQSTLGEGSTFTVYFPQP